MAAYNIIHITQKAPTFKDIKQNGVVIIETTTSEEITKDDEYHKKVASKPNNKVKYILDEYINIIH